MTLVLTLVLVVLLYNLCGANPHWLSFSMIVVRIKSLMFGMASKI